MSTNPSKQIAVVDSTTWISALQFGGTPRRALDTLARECRIATCEYIDAEVEKTLVRKFDWTADQVHRAMHDSLVSLPGMAVSGHLTGICRDPNDDIILECAVVAHARYLLTGDKDLLTLHQYAGIQIVSASEYLGLRRIAAQPAKA